MQLEKQNKIDKKMDVLDKAFLIFRPNDFPVYLKPVRLSFDRVCAITKRELKAGDYAFPCYDNPLRLAPNGPERCRVDAALKRGDAILPYGYHAAKIPTTDQLKERGLIVDSRRHKALEKEALKLLTKGKS